MNEELKEGVDDDAGAGSAAWGSSFGRGAKAKAKAEQRLADAKEHKLRWAMMLEKFSGATKLDEQAWNVLERHALHAGVDKAEAKREFGELPNFRDAFMRAWKQLQEVPSRARAGCFDRLQSVLRHYDTTQRAAAETKMVRAVRQVPWVQVSGSAGGVAVTSPGAPEFEFDESRKLSSGESAVFSRVSRLSLWATTPRDTTPSHTVPRSSIAGFFD